MTRKRILNTEMNNWLDDAFSDFQKNGGLEDNPYQGKPIPIDPAPLGENGALYSIMKNARVLPPWLELQHEIRDDLHRLQAEIEGMQSEQVDAELARINEKVKQYNVRVPNPVLQIGFATRQNLAAACERWS